MHLRTHLIGLAELVRSSALGVQAAAKQGGQLVSAVAWQVQVNKAGAPELLRSWRSGP